MTRNQLIQERARLERQMEAHVRRREMRDARRIGIEIDEIEDRIFAMRAQSQPVQQTQAASS